MVCFAGSIAIAVCSVGDCVGGQVPMAEEKEGRGRVSRKKSESELFQAELIETCRALQPSAACPAAIDKQRPERRRQSAHDTSLHLPISTLSIFLCQPYSPLCRLLSFQSHERMTQTPDAETRTCWRSNKMPTVQIRIPVFESPILSKTKHCGFLHRAKDC